VVEEFRAVIATWRPAAILFVMGEYVEIVLAGAKRTRGYAEKLAQGITPAQAGRKPVLTTGKVIDTNHPLFVYGHLSIYPARFFTLTGADASSVQAPEAWVTLFKAGAPCEDDVHGTIYPAWGEVLAQYLRATDAALAHLSTVHDAVLLGQTPDPKMREAFPTVGAIINFLSSAHSMMHLGQVSAWRRCMGLSGVL
jgi:hypothetical protein